MIQPTFFIAIRNLLRQKRRNFLLGLTICIGTIFLLMSQAFTYGIKDVLFNKVLAEWVGHVQVVFYKDNLVEKELFSNKELLLSKLTPFSDKIEHIKENISLFVRAVGNGEIDSLYVIGKDDISISDSFSVISGNPKDINNPKFQNPIILSAEKSKSLNVGLYDQVKIRFKTIHGQYQTASLTIVAIIKTNNPFLDYSTFIDLKKLKSLKGLLPTETGKLAIVLKNSSQMITVADQIHMALKGVQWEVLDRTYDSESLEYKLSQMIKTNKGSGSLDVQTANENASEVVNAVHAISLISWVAFVLLIGVASFGIVNTLSMTIHERRREIGALRAIGFKKVHIRNLFLIEIACLSFLSVTIGFFCTKLLIGGLQYIEISRENPISFFLINQKLHFLLPNQSVFLSLASIVLLCVMVTIIPARRAANLSVLKALSTYD